MTSAFGRVALVFYSYSVYIYRLSATVLRLPGFFSIIANGGMPISTTRGMTSPIDSLIPTLHRSAVGIFHLSLTVHKIFFFVLARFFHRGQTLLVFWGNQPSKHLFPTITPLKTPPYTRPRLFAPSSMTIGEVILRKKTDGLRNLQKPLMSRICWTASIRRISTKHDMFGLNDDVINHAKFHVDRWWGLNFPGQNLHVPTG